MTDPTSANSKLTVIIPAYKAASTISETITSIRTENATIPHIMVILDGADGETAAILNDLGVAYKVLAERSGVQAARNYGLSLCTTPYVTFIDADDVIEGPLHNSIVEALEQNAEFALASWRSENARLATVSKFTDIRDVANAATDRDRLMALWTTFNVSKTGAMGWRTEALRHIGGWNPELKRFQDVEVGYRTLERGLSVGYATEGVLIYRLNTSSGSVSKTPMTQAYASLSSFLFEMEINAERYSTRSEILNILGVRYYSLARESFQRGLTQEGRYFLLRARSCGFRRHIGSKMHQMLSSLIGLEAKMQLSRLMRAK